MLPANMLAAAIGKLALSDKPLITATPDKGGSLTALKLEVGQQVQGTVQSQVSPNLFQVRIADQLVQMQLPAFIRSGDQVSLQVVSLHPRLTFALASSTNPVSTSEQLSSASRMLSSLSQQPITRDYVRPTQQAPLWLAAQSAPDTAMLADKLHNALSHSGLFYESHQAQWIAGMRSTPQLMQEPQNQLSARQITTTNPTDSSAKANNSPAASEQLRNQLPQLPTVQQVSTANMIDNLAKTNSQVQAIPEHLQNLVQQQMQALETRQVLWQGQAWQEQEMRWEVREELQHRQANAPHEGQWVTELHLDLPHLGSVSARLSFKSGAVNLAFEVRDDQTRDLLANASAQLVSALSERDIPVLQTSISRTDSVST